MIYTDQQLVKKIRKMIVDFEDEVVEFKEARTNYSFKDIGKYFSALGNEANIRGLKEAWLIFGVTNNKEIVGSAYRQDGNLQHLKKEIVGGTNERATFMEIYELIMDGHRIVAFQMVLCQDLVQVKMSFSHSNLPAIPKLPVDTILQNHRVTYNRNDYEFVWYYKTFPSIQIPGGMHVCNC